MPDAADLVVDLGGDLPEATLIVDALWGEPLERALAAAATGVRIVHLGQSAGPTATLPSAAVRGKVCELHGHSLFATPLDVLARGYRELCAHVRRTAASASTSRRTTSTTSPTPGSASRAASPGAKVVVTLR